MLSADRERESGSRHSLADLACTSVHHPGVRQSLVHLRDEDGAPARRGERGSKPCSASVFSSPPPPLLMLTIALEGRGGEGGHKGAPKESPFLTDMFTLLFRDGSPGASAARRTPSSRPGSPKAARTKSPARGRRSHRVAPLGRRAPGLGSRLCAAAQSAAMARLRGTSEPPPRAEISAEQSVRPEPLPAM